MWKNLSNNFYHIYANVHKNIHIYHVKPMYARNMNDHGNEHKHMKYKCSQNSHCHKNHPLELEIIQISWKDINKSILSQ